jgi:glucose/arabinose dehydrogenase
MRTLCCGVGLLLLALGAACSTDPVPTDPVLDPPPAGSEVRTTVLTPTPLHLTVEALPDPYHTGSASRSARVGGIPADPVLQVPAGFRVNVYAEGLSGPRQMVNTPEGDVLVAESGSNRIRRLRDMNADGQADEITLFGDETNGLSRPFGMAFAGVHLYIANTGAVVRFSYSTGMPRLTGTGTTITTLPTGGHWTRDLRLSPDGQQFYISIGSASNVNPEAPPRAAVEVMNLDGSGRATFASGLRNPVGLDVHPTTGEPYTVVNERDGLGDDLVPDYLTRLQKGAFFGWPYAWLTPDRLDPRRMNGITSERPDLAALTTTPDVLFQAHSAPLGLRFYTGTQFPQPWRNGAFVALHGSWNRNTGTGYKIVFVPFDASGRPTGAYEDFLTGFLTDPTGPDTWGRPVGLLVLPDGSLLVSDDGNGRIYRVSYRP